MAATVTATTTVTITLSLVEALKAAQAAAWAEYNSLLKAEAGCGGLSPEWDAWFKHRTDMLFDMANGFDKLIKEVEAP